MLCVRWGGGLEFGENMVVGESNAMPARRRGQTWTSFPGSAQARHTFRHHFPAHEHRCHRTVKSSCNHCPKCMYVQYPTSHIQLHYSYYRIPMAVRPATTSSVSRYHPPIDKQVPSPLHILHPVRLQVYLFCSHVEGALPAQRDRRSCP